MSVFRVERNRNYTVMSNYHLRDRRLSLKAKGLLSQMLSLPEDWDYTLGGLAQINREKIDAICKKIYRAKQVVYQAPAKKMLEELEKNGFDRLAVCVAKTQYSFSDDAALLAAPEGFTMTVRDLRLSAGAGFVVAVMGSIMTMPGLPKKPAAESIDVDENGMITGLF